MTKSANQILTQFKIFIIDKNSKTQYGTTNLKIQIVTTPKKLQLRQNMKTQILTTLKTLKLSQNSKS